MVGDRPSCSTRVRGAAAWILSAALIGAICLFGAGWIASGCVNDPAQVRPCQPGDTDCSGRCVDTRLDPENCGACSTACGSGEVCSAGACGSECGGGTTPCGQSCVDTNIDPSNCGSCATACGSGEVCSAGACSSGCSGGTTPCGQSCVDTNVDPNNCGACGNACMGGMLCSVGMCAVSCGGGTTQCGSLCVDTDLDPANCGTCGNTCPGSQCVGGMCGDAPSCRKLYADGTVTSGNYPIDPDGPAGNPPFDVYCDMDTEGGGWTRIASIGETALTLTAQSYAGGLGDLMALSYIHACTKLAGFGDQTTVRLTMGSVVDYFKPVQGNDVCAMLQATALHTWSATLTGVYVAPVYHPSTLLGGSNVGWPSDGRQYLSFWGGSASQSGCCHVIYGGGAAWNRTFVIDIREP